MNNKLEKLIEELRRMPPIEQVGSYKRYRVIARALDKKGRVLATRTNSYTHTHPVQKGFAIRAGRPQGEFLHAEISCLLASRAEVHTLLIARVSKDGIPVPAKPCEICTLAILEYGVKEIIHT